jgi:protocatechuate 3,4-dioxygenase beta subunit
VLRALALVALLLGLPENADAQSACAPTRADMLGPFYEPGAPERSTTGRGFVVSGIVRSAKGCLALPAARLEWWSATPSGEYDREHRATQDTDGGGRYRYETSVPGRYPGRPPHVHVRVSAPGHRTLVTQLYPEHGETALQMDFVLTPD